MRQVSEYRQHAQDCRDLAKQITNPKHLKQLEEMAEAWDMLAEQRARQLDKLGKMREPEQDNV